jgi:hypothetical protein
MKHNNNPKTELNVFDSHESSLNSPGPRTAQWKRRAKCNAVKHGIFASIVLSGDVFEESRDQYLKLVSSLRGAIQPVDGLEEVMVEKLAFLLLRLARVYRADGRVAHKLFERVSAALGEEHEPVITESIEKEREVAFLRRDPGPDLLLRYESTLDRQIDRVLDRIERLKAMRQGLTVSPPIKVDLCS